MKPPLVLNNGDLLYSKFLEWHLLIIKRYDAYAWQCLILELGIFHYIEEHELVDPEAFSFI